MNKNNMKSEYGVLLVDLIKKKGMTQADFCKELGKKKPYFYDFIREKSNPPPQDVQLKIIEILQPKERDKIKLLNLASELRNELPADITKFLLNNKKEYDEIRIRICKK